MKKTLLFLCLFVLFASACDLTVKTKSINSTSTPSDLAVPSIEPATTTPEIFISLTQAIPSTLMPDPGQPSFAGLETTHGVLTLVVPPAVADGASGQEYPPVTNEDAAYWQKTPGHLQVMLGEYYILKDKSHQATIYVYPVQAYAELVPATFESIHRLNNILGNPGAPIDPKTLPAVPFFNAQQVFASHIEVVSFQNGKGIRFLTEYAQYAASANNNDLFYNFIGVTNDGAYYIVAVLPITHPQLAETSDGGAIVPPGGIPYEYFSDPNVDMMLYYTSVVQLLNTSSADAFTPTIGQLDLLIQSMQVAP